MKEGRWTNALAVQGDYYFIQFGHNNEPSKPGRSTDMPTFVSDLEKYVADARAIGAKPVLVTPLSRRQWDKANPGEIKSSLVPYAEVVRKIAMEKNVPLIELHDRSLEYYEKVGRAEVEKFSPIKTVDGTHLAGIGRVLMRGWPWRKFVRPFRSSRRTCAQSRWRKASRRTSGAA